MVIQIAESLDVLRVTRRVGYVFTLIVTWQSMQWCFQYATYALSQEVSQAEVALVIAAILVPVSGLQGVAIKLYHDDRPIK